MKKVSILLLLTVVLASFAFAIEGVGDFDASLEITVPNVGSANDGKPKITLEPAIKFSRAFGAVGLSATLGDNLVIDTDSDNDDPIGDGLYINVTPSFTTQAGPGELGIALGLQANFALTDKKSAALIGGDYLTKDGMAPFFRVDPSLSYGLDAGFGALAFELGTDHLQISGNHGDAKDEYGVDRVPLYLQAGVDLPFGLGLWVKPYLGIKTEDGDEDTGLDQFVFDIHYAINEQITAGVETTIPTGSKDDGADIKGVGVTVIPRGEFSFGALGAYVKVEISALGQETVDSAGKTSTSDPVIKPIIGVSYSF
jgi:hypothetical protein